MQDWNRLKKRSKGFSLMELLIVLAVLITITAFVYQMLKGVRDRNTVNNEQSFVTTLAQDAVTLFKQAGSFAGASDQTLVQLGAVREHARKAANNAIRTGFGGLYQVNAATTVFQNDTLRLQLSVPRRMCAEFVVGVAPTFERIAVGSQVVRNVTPGNNTEINPTSLSSSCNASAAGDVTVVLDKLLI